MDPNLYRPEGAWGLRFSDPGTVRDRFGGHFAWFGEARMPPLNHARQTGMSAPPILEEFPDGPDRNVRPTEESAESVRWVAHCRQQRYNRRPQGDSMKPRYWL